MSHHGREIINTPQLHLTKPELSFYTVRMLTAASAIAEAGDKASVRHFIKVIYHYSSQKRIFHRKDFFGIFVIFL